MTLYVCGTPIGNLEDVSQRLLRVLREADVVAAEDTRVSRQLLSRFDIHPPRLVSFREDNQEAAGPELVAQLRSGSRVALLTDAGMPGISDPGPWLVAACRAEGLPIEIVPGPAAPLAALLASGFECQRFVFEGFLPRKGKARQARLQAIASEERPVVLFEAPHRVVETLEDLARVVPDRRICAARELTKKFEEVRVEVAARLLEGLETRGEFTLVVEAGTASAPQADEATLDAFLRERMAAGDSAREAAAAAATQLGVSKRDAYQRYLALTSC